MGTKREYPRPVSSLGLEMTPPETSRAHRSFGVALVTGASGFLGSRLCRALCAQGVQVRALHRSTSSLVGLEGLPVETSVGDILDSSTLAPAVRGVDIVFHVAAQSDYWRNPQGVVRAAADGTRNVIQAAADARVRRVVLTSSVGALGVPRRGELLNEQHAFNLAPRAFPYGYAKHASEQVARRAAEGRLELVIVNPSIVLGPGDLNRISGSIILEAARGLAFVTTGGGANYIHVDDVADGHLAAADRGRPGERYILGAENLTHTEALTAVAHMVGRRGPWLHLPDAAIPVVAWLMDIAGRFARLPMNAAQMRLSRHRLFCDVNKARTELGFAASRSFQQAAQEAYDWYRAQGMLPGAST
ncbi:MAG TPA: NAD-dependent epimerase/dehydratase family protein [Anaerolineales bacterium]|nr:NAD-dependent epimerase/dehydratase family protein [Anaerolineales bacterium]